VEINACRVPRGSPISHPGPFAVSRSTFQVELGARFGPRNYVTAEALPGSLVVAVWVNACHLAWRYSVSAGRCDSGNSLSTPPWLPGPGSPGRFEGKPHRVLQFRRSRPFIASVRHPARALPPRSRPGPPRGRRGRPVWALVGPAQDVRDPRVANHVPDLGPPGGETLPTRSITLSGAAGVTAVGSWKEQCAK